MGAGGSSSDHSCYWNKLVQKGNVPLKNALLQPARHAYDVSDLGPKKFAFGGLTYNRDDVTLTNEKGLKIVSSHWVPADELNCPECHDEGGRPCIVFLHGNSSSRVEAKSMLACGLSVGASVFAFDFSGSGMSEGEYVSLGHWEAHDVATVMLHLACTHRVSRVLLWGRSMGATTALLYGAKLLSSGGGAPTELLVNPPATTPGALAEPKPAALVGLFVDSAFSEFKALAEEQVQRASDVGVLTDAYTFEALTKIIAADAHFDLNDLRPINNAEKATTPALFVIASHDTSIDPSHGRALHAAYGGDKGLIRVRGDHTTQRPKGLFDATVGFLRHCLQVDATRYAVPRGVSAHNDLLPPWQSLNPRRPTKQAAPSAMPVAPLPLASPLAAVSPLAATSAVPATYGRLRAPGGCDQAAFASRPARVKCIHGKQPSKCRECGRLHFCVHDKYKSNCRECGTNFCEHGKQKSRCRTCGGSAFCVHEKNKSECRLCGGSSFCTHGKIKSNCRVCGASGFCAHGKRKSQCRECGGQV